MGGKWWKKLKNHLKIKISSMTLTWVSHVHDEKSTFYDFLAFFMVFNHANTWASCIHMVKIHNKSVKSKGGNQSNKIGDIHSETLNSGRTLKFRCILALVLKGQKSWIKLQKNQAQQTAKPLHQFANLSWMFLALMYEHQLFIDFSITEKSFNWCEMRKVLFNGSPPKNSHWN